MKRLLLLSITLFSLAASAQVKAKKIRKIAGTIKAKELKQKLSVIASADMEGRRTASAGQRKAAAYIESRFRQIGLLPGNGSSYQQVFNVYEDSLMGLALTANGQVLEANKDYTVSVGSIPNGAWTIDNAYFTGTGTLDTNNLPVEGKWAIIDEGNFFVLRQKIAVLMRRKAKGILVVSKNFPRKTPLATKSNMYMNAADEFPTITISYNTLGQIINKGKLDSAGFAAMAKQDYAASASIRVAKHKIRLESTNVMGLLPGTDRKDEYVFITGHYDHLGKRGDSIIYYGADDDGSGTTAVIELAEAFAKAKAKGYGPRRSIVFMTVSGEENGLWGSEYYSEHPVYPLDKTSMDLNIDMIGRIDPRYKGDSTNYVYVIGDDKLSSDLKPITDSVNRTYMNMELDRKYNDVNDPNRFYYRSDHYNFAKKGVPIIFYFNGTHADYHRPSDTVEKINFNLMEKRARLVFYTAWEVANRDDMLKRDIPLNVPPR